MGGGGANRKKVSWLRCGPVPTPFGWRKVCASVWWGSKFVRPGKFWTPHLALRWLIEVEGPDPCVNEAIHDAPSWVEEGSELHHVDGGAALRQGDVPTNSEGGKFWKCLGRSLNRWSAGMFGMTS